jgi:hypothetical protein
MSGIKIEEQLTNFNKIQNKNTKNLNFKDIISLTFHAIYKLCEIKNPHQDEFIKFKKEFEKRGYELLENEYNIKFLLFISPKERKLQLANQDLSLYINIFIF